LKGLIATALFLVCFGANAQSDEVQHRPGADVAKEALQMLYDDLQIPDQMTIYPGQGSSSGLTVLVGDFFLTKPFGTHFPNLCRVDTIWFHYYPPDKTYPAKVLSDISISHEFYFIADPELDVALDDSERRALDSRCKASTEKGSDVIASESDGSVVEGMSVLKELIAQSASSPDAIRFDCDVNIESCPAEIAKLNPRDLSYAYRCDRDGPDSCMELHVHDLVLYIWFHLEKHLFSRDRPAITRVQASVPVIE